MKRIFTILAAVSCMVMVTTFRAHATCSDGVVIKIGTTEINPANEADVFSDGKFCYNAAEHTLTLNGYQNISEGLYIDASAVDADFTIEVVGNVAFYTGAAALPLRFAKAYDGRGLIIEGNENAKLDLVATGSSAFNCAISCRVSYSDSKYYPLTVKGGMLLEASNTGTKTKTYPAIECSKLTIDDSEINARTSDDYSGTGVIYTAEDKIELKGKIQIFPASQTPWAFQTLRYNTLYPVVVNGFHLTDRTPELVSGDMQAIGSGAIVYNPETRTVYLKYDFQMEAKNDRATAALLIQDDANPTEPITIQSDHDKYHVFIAYSSLADGADGVVFKTPVKIDLNGSTLEIEAKKGHGMVVDSKVELSSSFKRGFVTVLGNQRGVTGGSTGELADEGVYIYATGKNDASFKGFTWNPSHVDFFPPHHWDSENKVAVDGSNIEVGNGTQVQIVASMNEINARSIPAGAGKFTATKDGISIDLPHNYTQDYTDTWDLEINAAASDANKYEFIDWTSGDTDPKYTYTVTGKEDVYNTANFRRLVSLNEKCYVVDGKTLKYWDAKANFKGDPTTIGDLPLTGSYGIYGAIYADGNIYFIEGDGAAENGIRKISFDGTTLGGSASDFVTVSTSYPQITEIAYRASDDCLYAILNDGNWQLYKFPLTDPSTPVKIAVVESPLILAMAFDDNGDLYALDYEDQLIKINLTTGERTKVGDVNLSSISSNAEVSAMYYEPSAKGFVAQEYGSMPDYHLTLFIDRATGAGEFIETRTMDCRGIFTYKAPLPSYKITIKSDNNLQGSVTPEVTDKEYKQGTKIDVTATPKEGWLFDRWSDGKEQSHQIEVKGAQTYTAYFKSDPENVQYPILINNKRLSSKNSANIVAPNVDFGLTAGSISYDDATKTLTLNNAQISAAGAALFVEGDASNPVPALKVVIKGICKLQGKDVIQLVHAKGVTFSGDNLADLSVVSSTGTALVLDESKVTFYGMSAVLSGKGGIIGSSTGNEALEIIGAALEVTGSTSGSIVGIKTYTTKYCKISSPASAEWKEATRNVEDGGGIVKSKITYKADLSIRALSKQDGTGTFTMALKDGSGETFKDGIGWFEAGKEVTINAKGATGFVFGRWEDDANWGDQSKKDDWLKANREVTKGALNETFTAIFYAQPASNVTWYGISDKSDHFVQYKGREYGAGVIESTSDASNITAGDCNGSYYYIADDANGEILRFNFSGVTKDKEQANLDKTQKIATYTGTITDMAYNFKDGKFYLVMDCDQKLYKINGENVDEIGEFITGELKTKVAVTCIAIDASGKKYVLSKAGILYTVKKESAKDKEVELELVGETGDIGYAPGNKPQSMAFDHVSGELYLGANDYLRVIDTKTAKSYFAGDLGQTKGNQGYIRALHRRDRKVTVAVEIAAECKDMGTVKVGPGEDTEYSLLQGASVTIVATPAEGYEFDHWAIKDDESSEPIKEATYTTSASSATYVAYFKSPEGIDEVQSQESGVQKVLQGGTIYIIREGEVYNVVGNRVK